MPGLSGSLLTGMGSVKTGAGGEGGGPSSREPFAEGVATEFLGVGQFSTFVSGCTMEKLSAGVFHVVINGDFGAVFVPVASPAIFATDPTKGISAIPNSFRFDANPDGTITASFKITCLDDAHAPIDCGASFACFRL